MTTSVYLYVTETMSDWETGHAVAHIAKPDWQREPGRYLVRTVATSPAPVRTAAGITIVPDSTFAELDPADAALLILPGADTWADATRHAAALAAARSFLDAGIPVAAICGGTWGLATAGLLDDRDHTSNAAEYLAMTGYAGGSRYRQDRAVTDRGLITASGTDPVHFAAAIFAALDLYRPEVLTAWQGLYTTGEARYFEALMAA